METTVFKTECQQEREARDMAVYREYNDLMALPGQRATEVNKKLMRKYGIHSAGTIYIIRKRVEERLNLNTPRV